MAEQGDVEQGRSFKESAASGAETAQLVPQPPAKPRRSFKDTGQEFHVDVTGAPRCSRNVQPALHARARERVCGASAE